VEAHVAFENVTIEGSVLLNPILEEYAVNKRKEAFEKSFKKKVTITWKQIQPIQQLAVKQPDAKEQHPTVQSEKTQLDQPSSD
jgi:hypothetical protein